MNDNCKWQSEMNHEDTIWICIAETTQTVLSNWRWREHVNQDFHNSRLVLTVPFSLSELEGTPAVPFCLRGLVDRQWRILTFPPAGPPYESLLTYFVFQHEISLADINIVGCNSDGSDPEDLSKNHGRGKRGARFRIQVKP